MNVIFITNYLSAHQMPLCDELYKKLQGNFKFFETGSIGEHRINLGWKQYEREYVFKYDEDCKNEIDNADVVIYGIASDNMIIDRLKNNKLTFKYAERFFKGKLSIIQWIRGYIGTYLHYIRYKKYPFYVLCASAYTAKDANKFFSFKNRCFKWGYFPEFSSYEDIECVVEKKEENSIAWAGRFLDWKHPEIPVLLAEKLKSRGYTFKIRIYGGGEMENQIKALVEEKKLKDCVYLMGTVRQEEMPQKLEKSQIFIFTSDSYEGWGAVLNEAMNAGCACIASDAIGSAPFLINNGTNGFLYKNGNLDDLCKKTEELLLDKNKSSDFGKRAYNTIKTEWNHIIAADRILKLFEALLRNEETPFKNGICSKAD